MKAGLEQLVAVCAGDEHSDCAILNNLASESEAKPKHAAKSVKPKRHSGARVPTLRDEVMAPSASQISLTAWMRGVHTHHGSH